MYGVVVYCCGMEDGEIIEKSVQWMNENNEHVLQKIVLDRNPRNARECIFMAGSPGAGKTETVRRLELRETFTVLEADEIRVLNPYYQKTTETERGNAHLLQKASSIGLDYCRAYCIEHEIAFVQDTTFSSRGSVDLVRKLLNKEWDIVVIFIFQNVEKAWEFVKVREMEEGRGVPEENFVYCFEEAIKNIEKVQEKYPAVRIVLNIKDGMETTESIELNDTITSVLVDKGVAIPDKKGIIDSIRNI